MDELVSKVVIDLDGVLMDFLEGAERNGYYDPQTRRLDMLGIRSAPTTFWLDLKPKAEGMQLIQGMLDLKAEHPDLKIIVVGLVFSEESVRAKKTWIKQHLYDLDFHTILVWKSEHKCMLADPSTLLIDDSSETCKNFTYRGGKSIIFRDDPERVLREVSASLI